MKFYIFILRYRLALSVLALFCAVLVNVQSGFWPSFVLYMFFFIGVFSHFVLGPMRIVQSEIEKGNVVAAKKIMKSIWFPSLLYKPIRSVYFSVNGSLAMMEKDFDGAEMSIKKSLDLGLPAKEVEGNNKLQLGMLSMQKGDIKKAESYIKSAIKDGLADNDSKAMAFLQLASILVNKREFRIAKDYYRKAKTINSKNEEIKEQIKQMDKYMSRIPG